MTISVPEEISAKAEACARGHKRSVSSYVSLLIEADLRAAGLMPPNDEANATAFHAKLTEALKTTPELQEQIEKLMRKSTRSKRAA